MASFTMTGIPGFFLAGNRRPRLCLWVNNPYSTKLGSTLADSVRTRSAARRSARRPKHDVGARRLERIYRLAPGISQVQRGPLLGVLVARQQDTSRTNPLLVSSYSRWFSAGL